MSASNKIDGNVEHKKSVTAPITAKSLENCNNEISTSYRIHTSLNSSISNDSDLSLLSLSLDTELEGNYHAVDMDELPAFEIRLISPLGRTPSPIDNENIVTPTRPTAFEGEAQNPCKNNPEFVALHDINAQISPPSDSGDDNASFSSQNASLETIYEGVFLNTPPRQRLCLQNNRYMRSQTNLLEKVALNRLNIGKENQSPTTKCKMSPRGASTDLTCETNSFSNVGEHANS